MTGAVLQVSGASWSPARHKPVVLHPTSFAVQAGRVLGIVGPNGAGKTTLLRLLYRYAKPTGGTVRLNGQDIWSLPAKTCAQQIAAVLQEQPSDFALTVGDIVALGRTPHRKGYGSADGARDTRVIASALAQLDLQALAHRHLGTLSGGERQRVMVARALAQEPSLLILDEPTNHLDIRHQLEILDLIRTLPLTIVTSLHDLNLAAGICDDILMLQDGRTIGFGTPGEVLTEAQVSRTFQVDARREYLAPSQTDHLTFQLHAKGPTP